MSKQSKLLTLMLAAAVGTMVVGCQRQEGAPGDSMKSSSGSSSMSKQGTATAPGDSAIAGGKEGATGSSRPGAMGAAPPPMTGEKSDSMSPSAGKTPGNEEGTAKPKGSS